MFVPRRLDKYLRDSTALSVVAIRSACETGRIAMSMSGGHLAHLVAPDALVFDDDVVSLDGHTVRPRAQHRYLVWNKPRFVTTTVNDPDGRTDLRPWLKQMPLGCFPVGRLDRETSGALLFSDDGDFANAVLQPGHHTEKLYWLWLDECLADEDPRLRSIVDGIRLDASSSSSALLRATSARVQFRTADYTELLVTLDEGKNRHIRKICNLLRLRLLQLHRKAIGTLHIDDLAIGEWRELTPDEVERLWSSSGGIARVFCNKVTALRHMAEAARTAGSPMVRLEAWLVQASCSTIGAPT